MVWRLPPQQHWWVDSPWNPPPQSPCGAAGLLGGLFFISRHHLGHELLEGGGGRPAQFLFGFTWIAQQGTGVGAGADLLHTLTLPPDWLPLMLV